MNRYRYLLLAASLHGLGSFIALLAGIEIYQCWLLERWLPWTYGEQLHFSEYCKRYGSERSIWTTPLLIPVVGLLIIPPTLKRLDSLGFKRIWALLCALPGLHLVLMAYLVLGKESRPVESVLVRELPPALIALALAGTLYFYQVIYFWWLMART